MTGEYVYEKWFFENMRDAYLQKHPWSLLRLRHIKNLVQPRKGEKIIDLGCAAGSVTHFCSTFGMKALGIDFSEIAIGMARKTYKGENISFLQRNVVDLRGIKDNSFDKAVSADLIEHLSQQDFEKMCGETYRVLRKGGTLSIYTPNLMHIIEIMKKHNFIIKQNPSHIGLRTMEQITDVLKEKGFNVELAYYAASHFPLWNLLETVMIHLPFLKNFFGYRVCIRARK